MTGAARQMRAGTEVYPTLLELVEAVEGSTGSDAEVMAVITNLISSGRVVLTATLAGAWVVKR
jgi:hypothetical protein